MHCHYLTLVFKSYLDIIKTNLHCPNVFQISAAEGVFLANWGNGCPWKTETVLIRFCFITPNSLYCNFVVIQLYLYRPVMSDVRRSRCRLWGVLIQINTEIYTIWTWHLGVRPNSTSVFGSDKKYTDTIWTWYLGLNPNSTSVFDSDKYRDTIWTWYLEVNPNSTSVFDSDKYRDAIWTW